MPQRKKTDHRQLQHQCTWVSSGTDTVGEVTKCTDVETGEIYFGAWLFHFSTFSIHFELYSVLCLWRRFCVNTLCQYSFLPQSVLLVSCAQYSVCGNVVVLFPPSVLLVHSVFLLSVLLQPTAYYLLPTSYYIVVNAHYCFSSNPPNTVHFRIMILFISK